MMSFIESLRPPGVSIVISTSAAFRRVASARPSSTYVARTGSTSPSRLKSITNGRAACSSFAPSGAADNNRNTNTATAEPISYDNRRANTFSLMVLWLASFRSASAPAADALPHNLAQVLGRAPTPSSRAQASSAQDRFAPASYGPPPSRAAQVQLVALGLPPRACSYAGIPRPFLGVRRRRAGRL